MKLRLEQMKKFSWGFSRSTYNIHRKVTKFTSAYGVVDAQKSTVRDLQRYLTEKKLKTSHGASENVHQTIRIYLAETFLQLVAGKQKTHRYYYYRFLELLEHYQSADPTFFMDDEFDDMVREPLERHVKKFEWSYSNPELA